MCLRSQIASEVDAMEKFHHNVSLLADSLASKSAALSTQARAAVATINHAKWPQASYFEGVAGSDGPITNFSQSIEAFLGHGGHLYLVPLVHGADFMGMVGAKLLAAATHILADHASGAWPLSKASLHSWESFYSAAQARAQHTPPSTQQQPQQGTHGTRPRCADLVSICHSSHTRRQHAAAAARPNDDASAETSLLPSSSSSSPTPASLADAHPADTAAGPAWWVLSPSGARAVAQHYSRDYALFRYLRERVCGDRGCTEALQRIIQKGEQYLEITGE